MRKLKLQRNGALAQFALNAVLLEMEAQDQKWGWPRPERLLEPDPVLSPLLPHLEQMAREQMKAHGSTWQTILMEEVGEAARESSVSDRLGELIQIAAVVLSQAQQTVETLTNVELARALTVDNATRLGSLLLIAESERRGFPEGWYEGGWTDEEIAAWGQQKSLVELVLDSLECCHDGPEHFQYFGILGVFRFGFERPCEKDPEVSRDWNMEVSEYISNAPCDGYKELFYGCWAGSEGKPLSDVVAEALRASGLSRREGEVRAEAARWSRREAGAS